MFDFGLQLHNCGSAPRGFFKVFLSNPYSTISSLYGPEAPQIKCHFHRYKSNFIARPNRLHNNLLDLNRSIWLMLSPASHKSFTSVDILRDDLQK